MSHQGKTVTVRFNVAVSGGVAESVACTVKLKVPATVGVPDIFPAEFMINPPGGDELVDVSPHDIDPVPPFEISCWL